MRTLYLLVLVSEPQFPPPKRTTPIPVFGGLVAPCATFMLLPERMNPSVARTTRPSTDNAIRMRANTGRLLVLLGDARSRFLSAGVGSLTFSAVERASLGSSTSKPSNQGFRGLNSP